jgi:endonuclease YncB( thermonuclease family)
MRPVFVSTCQISTYLPKGPISMKVTRCLLRCGHIARCACRSLFAARSIRERRGMIGKDKLTCLITTLSVYALLLPTAGLHVAHAATAEVIAVHDGDTLDVTIQGEKVRIRLYGIDAPERGQHGNVSSTRFLKRLVFEHPLEIRAIETDVFRSNARDYPSGRQEVKCQRRDCGQWLRVGESEPMYRLPLQSVEKNRITSPEAQTGNLVGF